MTSAFFENSDVKARDRFEILHLELRNRICMLDYAPGTRLSETELAEEFGVSRTPLRRVLARLEDEGLVHSVHGVGTFVTDVNIEELAQTYQLRMELAELVGKLSPKQPDAALSVRLSDLSHRAKALVQNPEPRAFAQLNLEFFLARLQLTDNAPLREISERLYIQTTRIWLKSFFASIIDLNEEIGVFAREVDEVTAAIELGDLQAAALIQRAHISMSYSRMKR
ncbi:GntR family transcriptional regulator [Aliiroseovarius crassostreae]|uniref:GntR family transcriptional regulator n=1 Tax=Aliiroseovarius crassostreae TaxID=154981 RepID=UPI00223B1FD8|nr:GntR family transcriptional regulator [Aliiroseovarius crassostreae]